MIKLYSWTYSILLEYTSSAPLKLEEPQLVMRLGVKVRE